MAARHLSEQIGRCRRDDDEVGLARQANVSDLLLVAEIEEVGEDLRVGEGANRKRRDELGSGSRQHGAHGRPLLAQASHEVEALVSGDAAADDEQNALLLHVELLLPVCSE